MATALLAYLPMSSSVALVAIALPRPAAARAVVAAWEAGEAVLPLDPGAPAAELKGILAAARPTHLLDADGRRRLPGGEPGRGRPGRGGRHLGHQRRPQGGRAGRRRGPLVGPGHLGRP